MHKGSCLCGAISYQFTEVAGDFVLCHCRSCRKASGAAGGINLAVSEQDFELSDPQGLLKTFESTPGKVRHFCSHCGSPLFTRVGDKGDYVRVRAGSLDTDLAQQPAAHIFMSHRARWDEPGRNIPEYDEWPDLDVVDIRGATKRRS